MSKLSGRPGRVARPGVEELEERAVPTLLGQQLFPSDYPWNQNVAGAPVARLPKKEANHPGNTAMPVHRLTVDCAK